MEDIEETEDTEEMEDTEVAVEVTATTAEEEGTEDLIGTVEIKQTSHVSDRLLKLQETTESKDGDETHEADGLLMHEVVFLNKRNVKPKDLESSTDGDKIWYLDNGASNHMTGNRSFFRTIDNMITGKVRFGDDSRIDIKGKGAVLFITPNGERKILADVYYIPKLKSNIISLVQAT